MSEIAGNSAIMIASEYLNNSRGGKGIVLGGISGITPAEIVILGAGTLGEFAARAALGLGATVKIFDHSVERLRKLNEVLGQRVFTSVFHKPVLDKALASADVLIGAMRCFDNGENTVVSEAQVRLMKRGAVIDRHIHDHRSSFHQPHLGFRNNGILSVIETTHSSDKHIGRSQRFIQYRFMKNRGKYPLSQNLVQLPETLDRMIEDFHGRSQA